MRLESININHGIDGRFELVRANDRAVFVRDLITGSAMSTTISEEVANFIAGPEVSERDMNLIHSAVQLLTKGGK